MPSGIVVCVYVGGAFMSVNESTHMLRHMRRDYRIILDVNHCLPLLFKPVYLVIHVYALFACPQTSGDFLFVAFHLSLGTWGS